MKNKIDKIMDLIFLLFIVFFPFLMTLEIRNLDSVFNNIYYKYNGIYMDFILSIKERFLLVYVLVIIFFLIVRIKNNKNVNFKNIFNDRVIVLSLIHIVFVIVSCIMNYNKYFTFFGSYSEGEGIIALICYQVLFIYFYLNKNVDYNKIRMGIKILLLLFSIFSILEKCDINLTKFSFFRNIITLGSINENIEIIEFNDNLKLTFGNSGYFGWFLTLLFPCLLFDLDDKNKFKTIFNLILLIFTMWMIIETGVSSCFYISLLNVFIYVFYKFNLKKIIVLFFIFILSFFNFDKVFGVLTNNLYFSDKFLIDEINIFDNVISFNSGEYQFNVKIDNEVIVYDQDFKRLEYEYMNNENVYVLNGKTIKLHNIDNYYIVDFGYKDSVEFIYENKINIIRDNVILEDNKFTYNKKLDTLYKMFTGRGYIWVNSKDIILKNIFIGSGPGSFMYEFNNKDYLGLLNAQDSTHFYIVKPHNMYIQTVCTSGGLSLIIIFLIIIIWIKYFIMSKKCNNFLFGLSIGVLNYLIIGFFNDSIILVAPYFWIFLGISLNYFKSNIKV